MELLDTRTFSTTDLPNVDDLITAVRALYPSKPQAAVTILLESFWLPILLVQLGPTLWTPAQVEVLMRHRMNLLQADPGEPTAPWELRVDYRVGAPFALGCGIRPGVKQLLVDAAAITGFRWAAMVPAFAWGLERLQFAAGWPQRAGWWAWPEQDRLILARIEPTGIVALNAGAACTAEPTHIMRLVDVEGARAGIRSIDQPIAAASWLLPPDLPQLPETAARNWRWVSIAQPLRLRRGLQKPMFAVGSRP